MSDEKIQKNMDSQLNPDIIVSEAAAEITNKKAVCSAEEEHEGDSVQVQNSAQEESAEQEHDALEEDAFESVAVEKKGFFSSLKNFFSFGKKKDVENEYDAAEEIIEGQSSESLGASEIVVNNEELLDDLRKSLRITFDLLNSVPKHQFEHFKESEHFQEYRKLIKKHKIKQL